MTLSHICCSVILYCSYYIIFEHMILHLIILCHNMNFIHVCMYVYV